MFETVETGAKLGKDEYERRLPDLRLGLVNAQFDLRQADFPVIIVVAGDDLRSVQEVMSGLGSWMDGRLIRIHAMGEATEEERMRPEFWRYWARLPGRGEMAVFADAWSFGPVRDRVLGRIDDDEFEAQLQQIHRFEADQSNSGALLIKFWLHIRKKELKKRLETAVAKKKKKKKKTRGAWRVGPSDELVLESYDAVMTLSQRLIEVTDEAASPWHVIESADHHYVDITLGETMLAALRARLDRPAPTPAKPIRAIARDAHTDSILETVDLQKRLERDDYKRKLEKQQARLHKLTDKAARKGVSSVLVFEGWDAAGKGGVIRRVVQAIDFRRVVVIPVAAPTPEEAAHHYLWRFWRQLPRAGEIVVFDRSWYGRVLVERVEGFANEGEWRRAYSEINDFEEQLVEAGTVVQKFWLHIDPEEQLARFEAREQTAYKKYKITDEDYRNREKWQQYVAAVDEMVARTSTRHAPWHLIPANDKPYARVKVLKKICAALAERV